MKQTPARRLLADRAYDALRASLQSGKYPPGTFLSERQLAHTLGMSTTPLKSALVRLKAEGFLRISPQQGIVVREASVQDIIELFDLREAIETFVVRKIAGKLTGVQSEGLKENLRGQEEAARDRRVADATRLDTAFHTMLCRFFGNREMIQALARMRDKLHLHILDNLLRSPDRLPVSVREHAAIAAAILNGREAQAAELVRRHLDYGRRFVLGQPAE